MSSKTRQLTFAWLHIPSTLLFPHSKSDTAAPCGVPSIPGRFSCLMRRLDCPGPVFPITFFNIPALALSPLYSLKHSGNCIPLSCQNNEKGANMLTNPSSIHKIAWNSLSAGISTLHTTQTVCDEMRSSWQTNTSSSFHTNTACLKSVWVWGLCLMVWRAFFISHPCTKCQLQTCPAHPQRGPWLGKALSLYGAEGKKMLNVGK